jgi:hypothetical protein
MREIEEASRLKTTALVGNTHLIDESTVENIIAGAEFTGEVGKSANLPVAFIGIMETYLKEIDNKITYPILSMTRLLLPPWALKKPLGRTVTHSRDRFGLLTKNRK